MVLWNIAKSSNSLAAFIETDYFAINVLSDSQRDVSTHFARSDHTLFDQFDFRLTELGSPLLPGAIAHFECRTHEVHECGDHHIVIGEVVNFDHDDGRPLLFFSGRYRSVDPDC